MIAIRTAAALLVLCCVALPAMAENARLAASSLAPGVPAAPPANAIPGTLDLATGQFTPLTANATNKVTVINKVYTWTPDFSKIGFEAAFIHTVSCSIFFPIVKSGGYPDFYGYQEAEAEFDLVNPPSPLSLHVFFSATVANPTVTIQFVCTATDDDDEVHRWSYYAPTLPIDKLPTTYTNAVIF